MKYRAIAWVAAVTCMPSAYAVDVNWDSHATTETLTRTVAKNVTFMDDARYLLTPAQSGNTGVHVAAGYNIMPYKFGDADVLNSAQLKVGLSVPLR